MELIAFLNRRSKGQRGESPFGTLNFWLRTTVMLLGLLLATQQGWCQLEAGSILGLVKDSTGAGVPRAHVTVHNLQTGATTKITADASGNFVAPVLALGTYQVTAVAAGFKQTVVENVTLAATERKRVDVALQPGATQETVTVTSQAPLMQAASSEIGDVISSKEVMNLPLNGRDITESLGLLPSTNGANTNYFQSSIAFTVDGTDASQIDSGFSGAAYNSSQRLTRASVDAVEEVQVQTSNFSAQWGSSNGGIFNIVTKSGTNNFHGSAFEYIRNEAADARNYFDAPPLVKPEDRLNQFGGTLGGPLKRNKLFFFGNYEGIRQLSGVTFYDVLVPTAAFRATLPAALRPIAAQLPLPNAGVSTQEPRLGFFNETTSNQLRENSGSVKVDYQLTPSDTISARWNGNQSSTLNYFGVAQGQARSVPGLLQTARVSYTKVISPTVYNEASFALNRVRYNDLSSNNPTIRQEPFIFSIGTGGTGTGPAEFDIHVGNASFTYLDTLSVVKGKNQFKFGVQFIRDQQNKLLNFQQDMTFLTLDQFAANNPYFVATLGYPTTGIRELYSNAFIQDDLQVSKRFTANLGLRYTYDTDPGEAHNRLENYDAATGALDPEGTPVTKMPKTELAPRIGFAYRATDDGKTVIRAGFGVFYNDINVAQVQELVDNWAGQSRIVFDFQDPTLTGFPFPPNLSNLFPPNVYGLPKNRWKNSHSYEWNLAVQRQLGKNASVEVAYVGNQNDNLSPVFDQNQPDLDGNRPNPTFGTVNVYEPCCGANYHGIQVKYKQQALKGFTWNVNYAYSRAMDYGGSTFGSSAFQNQNNLYAEYGPADYDQRNYFESDFVYEAPGIPKVPSWVGHGWQLNGIVSAASGTPYTLGTDVGTPEGDGAERPNLVPGVDPHTHPLNPPVGPELNINAFSDPDTGTYGNVGRNSMYGPRSVAMDASVLRNFAIHEHATLQFRLEGFNLFNHPNFSTPDSNIDDPNFGMSLGAGPSRQLQAAIRVNF